ncbi:MAG: tetratricopeptide repeat protein [Pirellulales bacterium]
MRFTNSIFCRLVVIPLLFFSTTPHADACLNDFSDGFGGDIHIDNAHYYLLEKRDKTTNWEDIYQNLKTELETDDNYKKRSDMTVAMIHLGKTQQAIDILVELEEKHPGEYTIAGNLGTAYELVGENELAIKWIKIGIH